MPGIGMSIMGEHILKHKPSAMTLEAFLGVYGGIYEHSLWIAEAAYECDGDIDTVESLHHAMKQAVVNGELDQKLALIKAHPDLGVAPADIDKLTTSSTAEQTGAGLKECTPDEFAEFQKLNKDYKERFGFPFIIAVKGLHRTDILQAFRSRILNDMNGEFETALEQINKIAYFRLMELAG